MTKPQLLIDQPAGIGDILWIQKIIKVLSQKYEVFHPVKDSISWMVDCVPTLCKAQDVPITCDKVLNLDGLVNIPEHLGGIVPPGAKISEDNKSWTGTYYLSYTKEEIREERFLHPYLRHKSRGTDLFRGGLMSADGKAWWTNKDSYLEDSMPVGDIVVSSAGFIGKRIMESKYLFTDIDWKDYLDYINIKRNKEKEEELFSLVSSGKPYRLVCPYYGTPETKTSSGALKMDIPLSTSLDNIELRNIEGYTLFDWLKVIQEAEEIYTTDTCILFLIELYPCKATELVCYTRRNSTTEIEYLFNKKWSYPKWK